jgi:2-polyprenyl-3-methyl-5-hydroxy-6-metoxy-1,4-benzoquinol methylase
MSNFSQAARLRQLADGDILNLPFGAAHSDKATRVATQEAKMATGAPPIEELKQKMKAVWMAGDFGRIAPLIQGEADAFVARLELKPGMKVLDVGCGTGNQAVPAARAGADVTAVDIAPSLLVQAAARAQEERVNINLREADAEELPYNDGEFDVVMSMFAAMFAPRPQVAVAEMRRVCRSGGLIAMANWTPDSFVAEQNNIMARYAPPPPPGLESPMLWGDETVVRERFGLGVAFSTTKRTLIFDIPLGPSETEAHFRQHIGPTQILMRQIDADRQKSLIDEMAAHWVKHNRGDGKRTIVHAEYLEVQARPN